MRRRPRLARPWVALLQEGLLTVAVKVLTEGPLLSRLWAKFSNRYLLGRHPGRPEHSADQHRFLICVERREGPGVSVLWPDGATVGLLRYGRTRVYGRVA